MFTIEELFFILLTGVIGGTIGRYLYFLLFPKKECKNDN